VSATASTPRDKGGAGTEPLRIIPAGVVLYIGEDKSISVVALRSLGATTIDVEVDPEGVIELLDTPPIPLADHPRREDCMIARIHVRPLIEDEETLLTVRCGDVEAITRSRFGPSAASPIPCRQPTSSSSAHDSSSPTGSGARSLYGHPSR
jgi:hypothetical protein